MPFVPPVRFTVSQVRVAAACPRILHFDAVDNRRKNRATPTVTRIWEPGTTSTAAGTLFHQAVERFNREAGKGPEVAAILEATAGDRVALYRGLMRRFTFETVNRKRLVDLPAEVIHNFTRCVEIYFGEMADILHLARMSGRPSAEIVGELFADLPKRVDLTVHVGPQQQPVHVVGRLDYVFFDRRSDRLRILDYKLAPASNPNKDQFQVATYATLYHHQHGYQCDAGVLYLHPERALVDMSWSQVRSQRHKVYDLLASMVEWSRFDPATGAGLHPPGQTTYCGACRWRKVCEARLGDKSVGDSLHGWSESTEAAEPRVEIAAVETVPSTEFDEELTDDVPENAGESDASLVALPDAASDGSITALSLDSAGRTIGAPTGNSSSAADSGSTPPTTGGGTKHGVGVESTRDGAELQLGATIDGARPIVIEKRHLSTHTAVVGAAGSGKTWLAKVFVEEAILCGVPVLAIDPQGDLVQFLRQSTDSRFPDAERGRQRRFLERVEPRIFTPGTSHGVRLTLSPVRLPSLEELAHLPESRRDEEYTSIVNAVALHLAALTLRGKRIIDQQQTFLARVLRGLVRPISAGVTKAGTAPRALTLEEIAAAVHAPENLGIDDADLLIKKGERENLGRQLYALAHGPLARLFTGGMTLDLDQLREPLTPGKTPLNVIYLNALGDQEKHAFLAALATEVYRWMSCRGGDASEPQLLFYLDEARDFLPAGASDPPAKKPVSRLFTQGRKFGVGCLVCTQSPRSVDYNVFGNCSTKIIGRLETPQDSDRVADWFTATGARPGWIAARAGAAPGSFVARWPDQPPEFDGAVFRSRPLYSLHEGAWSPDRVDTELAGDATHERLRGGGDS